MGRLCDEKVCMTHLRHWKKKPRMAEAWKKGDGMEGERMGEEDTGLC